MDELDEIFETERKPIADIEYGVIEIEEPEELVCTCDIDCDLCPIHSNEDED